MAKRAKVIRNQKSVSATFEAPTPAELQRAAKVIADALEAAGFEVVRLRKTPKKKPPRSLGKSELVAKMMADQRARRARLMGLGQHSDEPLLKSPRKKAPPAKKRPTVDPGYGQKR